MPAVVLEPITESAEERWFSSVAGALLCGATADALGWITEFVRGPTHLHKLYGSDRVTDFRPWQKKSGGRFNAYIDYISRGEYSDDTQLTLAVARSLRADGSLDIDHFSKTELPLWLDYARGAGSTITAAARGLQRRSARWNSNFFGYKHRNTARDYRNAGANGAAMRIAPIALANLSDADQMSIGVWQTSICTHGHPRAILGALLLAEAIRRSATEGPNAHETLARDLLKFVSEATVPGDNDFVDWLKHWNEGHERDFRHVWELTKEEVTAGLDLVRTVTEPQAAEEVMRQLGCFAPETKGSGTATVLASLAVVQAFRHDLREAVLFAVNALGSDTDTIAGFIGAMSGGAHGYGAIPHEWASALQDYDYFMRVATEVTRISCRRGVGGQALLPSGGERRSDLVDLLGRLRDHNVSEGERVFHPLFGAGWVKSVDAQRLRRKDEASMIFAWVIFDIGQSCKFRYMTVPRGRPKKRSQGQSRGQPGLFG